MIIVKLFGIVSIWVGLISFDQLQTKLVKITKILIHDVSGIPIFPSLMACSSTTKLVILIIHIPNES